MLTLTRYLLFLLCLTLSCITHADTDLTNEHRAIEEAKALYAKALPMALQSPDRREILNEAADILNRVISLNPESLEAHRKLVGVYLLQQDYSRAIRTMQSAITLSPKDPRLFISLAFLYEHSGALELADGMLAQALKLDPTEQIAIDYKQVIEHKLEMAESGMQAHQGLNQVPDDHAHRGLDR